MCACVCLRMYACVCVCERMSEKEREQGGESACECCLWIFGHFEHLKVFLLCMRKINDFRGSCTEKNQLGAHLFKFKILTFTKAISRALAAWASRLMS